MDAATGNERRPIFDYLLQSFTFNGSVCIYVSYFRMLSNAICSRVILRGDVVVRLSLITLSLLWSKGIVIHILLAVDQNNACFLQR